MTIPLYDRLESAFPKSLHPLLRWSVGVSLLCHLLSANYNIGYHHADEQFQVLELASYKLGITPKEDLAWEYSRAVRPGLQPWLAYMLIKAQMALGISSPFSLAKGLRIVISLLNFMMQWVVICWGVREIHRLSGKRWLLYMAGWLWFLPYVHARFSAESLSGVFLAGGAILLFVGLIKAEYQKVKGRRENIPLTGVLWHVHPLVFLSGILFGLSFHVRYQVTFALIGLGLWLWWSGRFSYRGWLLMCGGLGVGVVIGGLADVWLYEEWQPVAWNYVAVNLLEGKADEFGVSPIWWYFTEFLVTAAPPLSLFIIAAVIGACFKRKNHQLIWMMGAFIIGHSLISHKEMRFLLPLSLFLPVLVGMGVEQADNIKGRWRLNTNVALLRWALTIIFIFGINVNLILLGIAVIRPANESAPIYAALYSLLEPKPESDRVVIGYQLRPYEDVGVVTRFYQPKGVDRNQCATLLELDSLLTQKLKHEKRTEVLVMSTDVKTSDSLKNAGYKVTLKADAIPDWITEFNYFDWLSRTRSIRVYEVKLKAEKNKG